MNPQEKANIEVYRRERGYPLHAPPHPFRDAGWYLITAANFLHQSVMCTPQRRDEFEAKLLQAFQGINAEIGGWVILPNHYHILAGVDGLDEVSAVLKQLHGSTSHDWNQIDGCTGQRRVWYKFSDRWIRGERHYYCALNYIHYNPLKHACVDDPYAWVWSSVHMYYDTNGRDWLRSTWRDYPISELGGDWDS